MIEDNFNALKVSNLGVSGAKALKVSNLGVSGANNWVNKD